MDSISSETTCIIFGFFLYFLIFTSLVAMFVKKFLTKNFLFAEKVIIYFAKTQCPEAAKTLSACTFYNLFSDWSNIFHTWFLIGLTKMIFPRVKNIVFFTCV